MRKILATSCRTQWVTFLTAAAITSLMVAAAFSLSGPILADDPAPDSDYELRCPGPVLEGDVFSIKVAISDETGSGRTGPIEGYWSTRQITADTTDYPHMQPTHQVANDFERLMDEMRRNFRTFDDLYSEDDETFEIRFSESEDSESGLSCTITIQDDDGPGVSGIAIISTPSDGIAYRAGESILIHVRFTEPVQMEGEVKLEIRVGEGDNDKRLASYYYQHRSDTIVFKYRVHPGDFDENGIEVLGGEVNDRGLTSGFSGDGSITAVDDGQDVNDRYRGIASEPKHAVDALTN